MSVLVIGSTNIDISVEVDRFPIKGETLIGNSIAYKYGGKGANQACALGKLGADVTFLTCVGNDAHGHEIIEYLTSVGVKTDKVKYTEAYPTGTATITVDANGDNIIVVIQGANKGCDVSYIRENEDSFRNCDYVLLQMEIPFDAIEEAILLAAKYSKKVVLNPAPASKELNKTLYKHITYMTPNEVEINVMAGDGDTLEENACHLLALGIDNVLVTLGSEGARLFSDATESIHVPAYKVEAVDTVAAGDCFNGAFVAALDRGENVREALKFANRASAIAVMRKGAQESIPTKEEMEQSLIGK